MPDDTSLIWKWYTQERIRESSLFIPMDMGMQFVRNMTCGELAEIIRGSAKDQPLTGELRSFLNDGLNQSQGGRYIGMTYWEKLSF